MIKYFLLFSFVFLVTTESFPQTKFEVDTFNLRGKWTICVKLEFSKDFKCDKGYVTYEFFLNGTFKDPRPSIDGGGNHEFSLGKWTLSHNKLIIDYDDTEFSQSPPVTYTVTFLNKDKFYDVGKEGENGVTTYTYFQKVD